jgi:hypothetical protein
MLADQTRWSQAHGKTPVPSRWQATGGDTDTLSDADLASLTPIREVTAQRFNHSPVTNASRGQRLVHPSITRHPGATAAQG